MKYLNRILIGFVVIILLVIANPSLAKAETDSAQLAKAVQEIENLDAMRSGLASTLKDATTEATIETFKEVCKPVGMRAMQLSKENGWQVKQIATKYRNPAHAPDNLHSVMALAKFENDTTQPALASIRQMEEAPGQVLIQSRHTLKDNRGDSWQVVLFKRTKADGLSEIHLRLVDFPGLADFAHPQPLTITTNQGDSFEAEDVFAEKAPGANVGEFNVQNILSKLPVTQLNLSLPVKSSSSIKLSIPSEVVLEWQELT